MKLFLAFTRLYKFTSGQYPVQLKGKEQTIMRSILPVFIFILFALFNDHSINFTS